MRTSGTFYPVLVFSFATVYSGSVDGVTSHHIKFIVIENIQSLG